MVFNSTVLKIFADNPDTYVETFSTSKGGIITATCSSILSIVGSASIIVFIRRSDRRLSTPYHRIMFGMSIFDLIQSICIALSTMPMPTDMIYTQFEGLVAGTTTTCTIQGFLILTSSFTTLMFNPILCIYYVFSICLRFKDERFSRFIEPLLYTFATMSSLVIMSIAVHLGQVNPSPVNYPWCSHDRYPWWCDDDKPECSYARGNYAAAELPTAISNIIVVLSALIVITSMFIVTCYVYKQERMFKSFLNSSSAEVQNENRLCLYKKNMQHTRDVLFSAVLYTLTFFAVWHFPFVRAIKGHGDVTHAEEIIRLIFRPSQGFLNIIVFVYHKIRNLQNHRPDLSTSAALRQTFARKGDPEHIVSNLTLVRRHNDLGELQFAFQGAVEYEDEDPWCKSNADDNINRNGDDNNDNDDDNDDDSNLPDVPHARSSTNASSGIHSGSHSQASYSEFSMNSPSAGKSSYFAISNCSGINEVPQSSEENTSRQFYTS